MKPIMVLLALATLGIARQFAEAGECNPCYVDGAYSGFENGSPATPWNTVLEGSISVSVGGTVFIAPGFYAETLTLSGPMTLQRWGATGTVVLGQLRHLYIVAHQDDDLLFMNPDIQHSIDAGCHVTTVYVTAGSGSCSSPYYLVREGGVKAAYARMAGVADHWVQVANSPVRFQLTAQPRVSLVFLRLADGTPSGCKLCPQDATLGMLWSGQAATIRAADGSGAVYTRAELIDVIAGVFSEFAPHRIGTLDSTGLFGTGQDPSGYLINYSCLGTVDWYDNSNHYYSAVFAVAARQTYTRPHEFRGYRGYNIVNEGANVSGNDLVRKSAAFEAYSEHDPFIPDDPPFGNAYDCWLRRQYTGPAPSGNTAGYVPCDCPCDFNCPPCPP